MNVSTLSFDSLISPTLVDSLMSPDEDEVVFFLYLLFLYFQLFF